MQITLTTSLSAVLAQVAQSSAYTGAKRQENPKAQDPEALDRIATVDDDASELTMFFNDCRVPLVELFASKVAAEGIDSEDNDTYNLVLNVSDDFNQALLPAMNHNLFSYFVQGILAAWLVYVHDERYTDYANQSMLLLNQLHGATARRAFTRVMFP